ncbi:MAG: PepSY domain-containing protein [Alphaproteobacteria bacterium]
MKKIIAIFLLLSFSPSLAFAQQISASSAKRIALKDAGVTSKSIRDYDLDIDRENGRKVYEIDFKYKGREYDYKIDANSGKILRKNVERD